MLKTHQSIAKRVRVTKTGKVIKKKAGQDHFNSRESGNITRKKRRDVQLTKQHAKNIKSYLPHN
ncbi:50S ribosomal protein L35 [Candidatus Falkowbacteria bacterium]|nr:50S ribosomal protein L35 [Candidatus Falkowbacteria bacterium]